MAEFHAMARKGRVYLFGNGELKTNPIHGEDLAVVCVDAIEKTDRVIEAGGPKIMTHNQIATAAFNAVGSKPKITHIPDWIRVATLAGARAFTSSKTYGPIEFFLTVMAMDMIAPEYGKHTLKDYFTSL
jgi:nucleoside-diphosphate-sugar epimerase